MSEMVERVSRVLYSNGIDDLDKASLEQKDRFIHLARVVIESMRHPTAKMKEADIAASKNPRAPKFAILWPSLIDEVLK